MAMIRQKIATRLVMRITIYSGEVKWQRKMRGDDHAEKF
jgi:hypothetical protein